MSNWTIIQSYTYHQDAHMVKNYLERNDFEVMLKDELTAQVDNIHADAIGGVKVMVHEEDVVRAIQCMKEGGYVQTEEGKINADSEFVFVEDSTNKSVCPFCKATTIKKLKRDNPIQAIVYSILSLFSPMFKPSYHCTTCNKVWKWK